VKIFVTLTFRIVSSIEKLEDSSVNYIIAGLHWDFLSTVVSKNFSFHFDNFLFKTIFRF